MHEKPSFIETLTGLAVLAAVGAQTWIVVQEATQGDAGRWVQRFWQRSIRPTVVRVVLWVDSKAHVERMISEEIVPFLEGNHE